MKLLYKIALLLFAGTMIVSCKHENKNRAAVISDAEVLHQNEDQLTQMIIYDVFSPPVASRIYAYASLASYEAMRYANPKYPSIITQLKGFDAPPQPEPGKKYNFVLAATKALFTVTRKVTFSVDSLKRYEDAVYARFKSQMDDSTYARSVAFGEKVGSVVLKRSMTDNYPQTRAKPKFLGSNLSGKWHPTPPDYLDAVEYCWGTMKPFVLESSSQFPLPPPPMYSKDTSSSYFQQ
ncbi:MAG: phosphoesterase, partial [Mucilaginibacter sp.]|nr:phosphoesterase [Mucilaginibacter sp.]